MSPLIRRLAKMAGLPGLLLILTACGGPTPADAPPPSAQVAAPYPAAPPELAGGPVTPPPLAGGPPSSTAIAERPLPPTPRNLKTWRDARGRLITAMAPVPNPESLSAAERRRIYGAYYAARARMRARLAPSHPMSTARHAAPAVKRPAVAAMKPQAAPLPAPKAAMKPLAAAKPAPIVAAPPKTVAVAPPPVAVAKPKAPAAPLAKATPALALQTPGQRLTTALSDEVATGSKLTVPETLAPGETGQVSLSLPDTLFAAIQREAAKLGLGKSARTAEVTAVLSGDGYEITPNGAQTAKLKKGEAPTFTWQVKPGAGEKSPLHAQVDGMLTGLRNPMPFSLTTLVEALKAKLPEPKPADTGFHLPTGSIVMPGIGSLPTKSVLGAALLLIALVVLVVLSRNASVARERAAARRRFRTMTDYGRNPMEDEPAAGPTVIHAEPEPAVEVEEAPRPLSPAQNYVSPMIAAAAAGAVAAAVVHHHHVEEAHAEEAKAEEAAGHAHAVEAEAQHEAAVEAEHAGEPVAAAEHHEAAVEAGHAAEGHAEAAEAHVAEVHAAQVESHEPVVIATPPVTAAAEPHAPAPHPEPVH